jgi:catechol-2,3-dioxygenase
MTPPPNAQLTHLGLFVRDMGAMVDFYTRVMGMLVTDVGELRGRRLTFLSRDPREHHQLVLADGRGDDTTPVLNQISFRIDSLADLRRFYRLLVEEGVQGLDPVTHGAAWSVYFPDPEGNRLELYTDTEWYVRQPLREPIDLTAEEDEIRAATLALVGGDATLKPLREWSAEMKARLGG